MMRGIGLMAGTSLDGVDAALVTFATDGTPALERFVTIPYPDALRNDLLDLMAHGDTRALARLDATVGRALADAALAARAHTAVDFVASHGQTVWHEPGVATLQIGDPAVIAEACGVPVVADFRRADIAAGGQGAPLVPLADALLFGNVDGPRTLLNIGGMANVTYVPRRGGTDGVVAFDTGPGVAVMDLVARMVDPSQRFDVDGALAARGRAHEPLIAELLADPWFSQPPPKSTGRERFGQAVADHIVGVCGRTHDAVATATAFTARSIAIQTDRWVPSPRGDLLVSGGGLHNRTLCASLPPFLPFSSCFFDADAKEALVFAWLGWRTLHGLRGNLPAATGARGPRVLGGVWRGVT